MSEWLLGQKEFVAERGTDRFVPPELDELLLMDEEVIQPVLIAARSATNAKRLSKTQRYRLEAAARTAAALNYELTVCNDSVTGQDYLVMAETGLVPQRRHWGTYVVRLGTTQPKIVEVPCPLAESNAYEYGVSLFHQSTASVLILAGAHPRANLDGSADVVQLAHKSNLFNLFHQILLREFDDRSL